MVRILSWKTKVNNKKVLHCRVLARNPTALKPSDGTWGSKHSDPSIWEFPKIRGTLLWGPQSKDPTI